MMSACFGERGTRTPSDDFLECWGRGLKPNYGIIILVVVTRGKESDLISHDGVIFVRSLHD